MHRFFASAPGEIAGEEAAHLSRVLRLDAGEEIEVLLGGERYAAVLTQVEKAAARYTVTDTLPSHEPKTKVTLYQGLCKGEKLEWITQKCTELGVSAIVPVVMERTVKKEAGAAKLERLARIAREAVKQCGRSVVPQIAEAMPFRSALERMKQHGTLLMPYECGGEVLRAPLGGDIGILIGPEGGITQAEAQAVLDAGGRAVTLGERILRTETAGFTALTLCMYLSGDMGEM